MGPEAVKTLGNYLCMSHIGLKRLKYKLKKILCCKFLDYKLLNQVFLVISSLILLQNRLAFEIVSSQNTERTP